MPKQFYRSSKMIIAVKKSDAERRNQINDNEISPSSSNAAGDNGILRQEGPEISGSFKQSNICRNRINDNEISPSTSKAAGDNGISHQEQTCTPPTPVIDENQATGISMAPYNDDESDTISDISNFLGSDDSIEYPDSLLSDLFGTKNSVYHFGNDDDSPAQDSGEEPVTLLPLLNTPTVTAAAITPPHSNGQKSVFIATYPDSIVFTNQQQVNDAESCNFKKQCDFIAKYPEPIFLYNNSDDQSDTTRVTGNDTVKINENKLKHPFIPVTCGEKCKRYCKLFTIEERKGLWDAYWNMSYGMRRNFLNKSTNIEAIKRRKVQETNPDPKHCKNESRYFMLPKNDKTLNVCRKFFLNTLGHKTDAVITELSKAIKRKQLFGDVKENRGGKKPKLNRDPVTEHILSYNPAVSHYRRNNALLAKYLPRTLTLKKMHSDFKKKHPGLTVGKELYRQTVKKMNISFKFPKGDKCFDCGIFEQEVAKYNEEEVPEDLKAAYDIHRIKSNKAIQAYQEDASKENTATVRHYNAYCRSIDIIMSMDLQKVMLLPDMPKAKDSFFLSRLIAFNLTFAPIKKTKTNSVCVLWHEAWAGRDGNNIVDAIAAFIEKERDIQHLIIWCDNCTGQNKNWILFTSLVTLVKCGFWNLESVTLKYLTEGHTHMTADGVHGNIETQIKRQNAVYDFADYKKIILDCRNNIETLEVQKSHEWTKKKRTPRRNAHKDPLSTFLLNTLVEVKFINGSRNIFYKKDLDEPYMELDFLMKKFDHRNLPATKTSPRGIKETKKEGIITKLVPLMPMNRRAFWMDLPVSSNSEDLVTGGNTFFVTDCYFVCLLLIKLNFNY